MPPKPLRDYQRRMFAGAQKALLEKQVALVVGPCGCGKTEVFLALAAWMRKYDRRVTMLFDRENLVSQSAERAEDYLQEPISICCKTASQKIDLSRPIVAASRQTLAPALKNGSGDYKTNLLIVDECHMAGAQQRFIINHLRENYPKMRVLLTTATPFRQFGGNIYGKPKDLADKIDVRITYAELLEAGWLAPLEWIYPEIIDLKLLDAAKKTATGEIDETEQAEILGNPTFIQGVYRVWLENATQRKTVIYAVNVAHAEAISDVFAQNGVIAPALHHKTKVRERDRIIKEFKQAGKLLINVGILRIGSDIPAITCIIFAHRTLSTAQFIQTYGRGSRTFAGDEWNPAKLDCLCIDLCGNCRIHGIDPDNPVTQIQDGEPGTQVKKICPMCEAECSQQARTCKKCGFAFPVASADPDDPDGQTKIEDHGDPGKLIKFGGFVTRFAVGVQYGYHQGPKGPCVECVYRCRDDAGKMLWVRQWKFPQAARDTFPQKDAKRYWFSLGGSYPAPVTVQDWLARAKVELTQNVKVTMDTQSGKYPVVKRVEAV